MEILHGESVVQSRQALQKKLDLARSQNQEIVRLEAKKSQLVDFKQALETLSLWSAGRLVIVENFFSQPVSRGQKEILAYLKTLPAAANLVFWENKKIDGRRLKALSLAKVSYFKLAPVIFRFLESIRPGNSREMLTLNLQCVHSDSAEMVFYMLCRQIRLLILAKDLGGQGLQPMPFWMAGKLLRQAENFSLEQLLFIHEKLLQIDSEQKTGQAVRPLDFYLDLLLASL